MGSWRMVLVCLRRVVRMRLRCRATPYGQDPVLLQHVDHGRPYCGCSRCWCRCRCKQCRWCLGQAAYLAWCAAVSIVVVLLVWVCVSAARRRSPCCYRGVWRALWWLHVCFAPPGCSTCRRARRHTERIHRGSNACAIVVARCLLPTLFCWMWWCGQSNI